MKRLIAVMAVAILVTAALAIAVPVGAKSQPGGVRATWESDILDVPSGDSLSRGEACVRVDGSVKVEIEGAAPLKTYWVWLVHGPAPSFQNLGSITTDGAGNGVLDTVLSSLSPPITGNIYAPRVTLTETLDPLSLRNPMFVSGFQAP